MVTTQKRKRNKPKALDSKSVTLDSADRKAGESRLGKRLHYSRFRHLIASYGFIVIALYTTFTGFLVLSNENPVSVPDDTYLYFMKPLFFTLYFGVYIYVIALSAKTVETLFDIFKVSIQAFCAIALVVLNYTEVYKYVGLIDVNGSLIKSPKICLYFSIVTYTTLGYGDYRPTEREQLFAASEAFFGYVLLGIFVGILLQSFYNLKQKT